MEKEGKNLGKRIKLRKIRAVFGSCGSFTAYWPFLFFVCVFVQVFFAGLGIFVDGEGLVLHREFAMYRSRACLILEKPSGAPGSTQSKISYVVPTVC